MGAIDLIEEAAADPELTADRAAVALVRVVLHQAVSGSTVGVAAAGELLKGLAALRTAGGGEDLLTVLQALSDGD